MKAVAVFSILTMTIFTRQAGAINRESGGRGGASAVFLNFSSFGTGIDRNSYSLAEKLIAAARVNGDIANEVRKAWGREGEILHCVELTSANRRYLFIRDLAPTIIQDRKETHFNRTSVRVSLSCDDFENATEQDLSAYLR